MLLQQGKQFYGNLTRLKIKVTAEFIYDLGLDRPRPIGSSADIGTVLENYTP